LLLPILMYHRVADLPKGTEGDWLAVSPEEFGRHLDWVAEAGWQAVTLRQAVSGLADERNIQGRSLVFSFDDGCQDVFDNGLPALGKFGWKATVFVSSGLAGQRDEFGAPLANWDVISEAARAGFEIGSHGSSHRRLSGLPREELEVEVRGSREEIGRHLEAAPDTFAYPYGEFDAACVDLVGNSGYLAAVTTEAGTINEAGDLLRLRRVPVYPGMSRFKFLNRLGRMYELYQRAKRMLRPGKTP
jgi:peptidoglycan/xylan/chitin deacetylase (PgdA/CDA1 family)